MFAQGVEMNGLIKPIMTVLRGAPGVLPLATVVIAWLLAQITGTAVGTAPLVINMMLPLTSRMATTMPVVELGGAGGMIGGLAAVAAQFGRTTSPVAPVTVMCATLSRTRPNALVARAIPALVAGAVAMLVAALFLR